MTYRERREARAERLRGWAEQRTARATAQLNSQPELRHDYAFITQPGRIPARERMNAADDRAFASLGKAESMASRADEIERQAAAAIYSDDPDAPEALRAKIERLEAERARWRDYNAAARKSRAVVQLPREAPHLASVDMAAIPADVLAILTPAEQRELLSLARVVPYQVGPHGEAPSYIGSNLSGNISRLRKRLDALEHPRPTWYHASRRDPGTCYKCDRPEAEHVPHASVPSVLMCPAVQR